MVADALIAGAGPAGCFLARQLSLSGARVVLVDRLPDPSRNAYSSAALPLIEADRLGIPSSCRSTVWAGWQLLDPYGLEHQWWSDDTLGVVLDFAGFRSWLWQQAEESGVELILGRTVSLQHLDDQGAQVTIRGHGGDSELRTCRHLVDATGAGRHLLRQADVALDSPEDPLLTGEGVEWLLQGSDRTTARWRDRLSFMLGTRWITHGYGWVFPMADHQLKVGVCRLAPPQERRQPLHTAMDQLLGQLDLDSLKVIDRHGGRVSSTIRRSECPGRGVLRSVGDAASTANLLGGEGIRHAADSALILADALLNGWSLDRYQKRLQTHFGWRWAVSNRLARRTWWGLNDENSDRRMDRLIHGLSGQAKAEDLSELLFSYRFERYGWRLLPYLR